MVALAFAGCTDPGASDDDTSEPGLMRPIAKLNTDCKVFFTLLQIRTARYMLVNGYISPTIQKAFLPGVAGCLQPSAA